MLDRGNTPSAEGSWEEEQQEIAVKPVVNWVLPGSEEDSSAREVKSTSKDESLFHSGAELTPHGHVSCQQITHRTGGKRPKSEEKGGCLQVVASGRQDSKTSSATACTARGEEVDLEGLVENSRVNTSYLSARMKRARGVWCFFEDHLRETERRPRPETFF